MTGPPFKVKALYEYSSPHEDDLSFPNGQIINVTEEEDADWYVGEFTDATGGHHAGLFPKNFVEKYEPEIPTRPTRAGRPKSQVQSPPQQQAEFEEKPDLEPPPPQLPLASKPAPAAAPEPSAGPTAPEPKQAVAEEQPAPPATAPAAVSGTAAKSTVETDTPGKKAPPPVAAKSNAFKDRIAAFNKQSDAPVLPFKPGAASGGGYAVKKPFVAPPPSRDAYVPPPKQEPVHRVYRREEDPEIAERQAEDLAAAENAGLTASTDLASPGEGDEEAAKPQSLKERIALLQKQQAEQAQRRADTASKEKPKRPSKRLTDSSDRPDDGQEAAESETPHPARSSQDAGLSGERTRSPAPMSRSSTKDIDILSDGNDADQSAAGETTEANEDTSDQEELERQRTLPGIAKANRAPAAPTQEADVGDEEGATEGQSDEGEEEDEVDEETRRKQELRERMAKISGGMGMAGMFGGPQPGMVFAQPKARPAKSRERARDTDEIASSPPPPPRAMIPVPGMTLPPRGRRTESPEPTAGSVEEALGSSAGTPVIEQPPAIGDAKPRLPPKDPAASRRSTDRGAPPPIPGDRPVPVPPSASARPPPPPGSRDLHVGGNPEEAFKRTSMETPRAVEPPARGAPPPVPGSRPSTDSARSPPPPVPGRALTSYFPDDAQSEASVASPEQRRVSRGAPPPIPGAIPISSPPLASRAPPPPPPAASGPHSVEDPDEGGSEYEGDYDTDIGSSEKHKAALKSHARQPSLDDSTTADDQSIHQSPALAPTSPPTTHRAVPPPLPGQAPPPRASSDVPRSAPPPPPPSRAPPADEVAEGEERDESFENYKRFQDSNRGAPPPPPPSAPLAMPTISHPQAQDSSDDLYDVPPKRSADAQRSVPPPPAAPVDNSPRAADLGRRSTDLNRGIPRRSTDQSRPLGDDFIARDVDLAESSQWWTQPDAPPPAFQNRSDVLFEIEESSTSKRGGKTTISKDIYVLFHDYSQTVITARFDSSNPADVNLEQRHEAPPPKLRQDQLEQAWQQYGAKIAEAAAALERKKEKDSSAVGDGSPFALPLDLIRSAAGPTALLPVGTRSYGAAVYANIGNASVQQFDEIRPGDFITFRNAKLQGKHGGLHQKYSADIGGTGGGAGGHVAVVLEWDGTKKKVRTVEQVRDEKGRTKVRGESYRLGDLKSGEVRVWRVVGRNWIGWDSEK